MSIRDDIVRDALEWLGTPFHHKGRIKGVGVDCGGLLYEVYNPHFGPFPPFPNYVSDWALHKDAERYLDFITPHVFEVNTVQKGGFSLLRLGRAFSHAGIYIGDDKYIHAWGYKSGGNVRINDTEDFIKLRRNTPVKHFELKWNT